MRARLSLFSLPLTLFFALSSGALLLSGCGGSAPSEAPPKKSAAGASGDESPAPHVAEPPALLYRVSGGGAVSYLLGTMHVGASASRILGRSGLALITGARTLYTEVSAEEMEKGAESLAAMMLPEHESLRGLLGDARFEALTARVAALPPEALDRFEPWAAAYLGSLFDMQRIAGERGGDPTASLDIQIQEHARVSGLTRRGLETNAEQLAVFGNLSRATTLKMVDDYLDPESLEITATLYEAFLSGSEAEVVAVLEREDWQHKSPEIYEALLKNRNLAWMPALTFAFREGSAFVAVGAAHLYGEDGLLTLLGAAGFEIERVTLEN